MSLEINIWLIVIFNILIAALHVGFWNLFNWKVQLARLSKVNKSILEVLNILSIYFLIFFSTILIYFNSTVVETTMGKVFLSYIAGFWVIRYILDFFYFELKTLNGKLFNLYLLFGVYIHIAILF
jgi:hypothetical protein